MKSYDEERKSMRNLGDLQYGDLQYGDRLVTNIIGSINHATQTNHCGTPTTGNLFSPPLINVLRREHEWNRTDGVWG